MSRVYVYQIARAGLFEDVGEAPNARNFHVAIWQYLGRTHHGWPKSYHCIASRGGRPGDPLEKLWAAIKEIPRAHGLAMAATYDRCWFPIGLREETADALTALAALPIDEWSSPTLSRAAEIVREIDRGALGFTFASSLASSWHCPKADDSAEAKWHHDVPFHMNGARCSACGKDDIENAAEIVAP